MKDWEKYQERYERIKKNPKYIKYVEKIPHCPYCGKMLVSSGMLFYCHRNKTAFFTKNGKEVAHFNPYS